MIGVHGELRISIRVSSCKLYSIEHLLFSASKAVIVDLACMTEQYWDVLTTIQKRSDVSMLRVADPHIEI